MHIRSWRPAALATGAALLACAAFATPALADVCLDDHTGDAQFRIRGRVAVEQTLTANDLAAAATAGTVTGKTVSVTYRSGSTPNNRTYVGVPLHQVMTRLAEPLFSATIHNHALRQPASCAARAPTRPGPPAAWSRDGRSPAAAATWSCSAAASRRSASR